MKIDITADGATITKVEPGHCVSDEVFVLGDTTDIGDAPDCAGERRTCFAAPAPADANDASC